MDVKQGGGGGGEFYLNVDGPLERRYRESADRDLEHPCERGGVFGNLAHEARSLLFP